MVQMHSISSRRDRIQPHTTDRPAQKMATVLVTAALSYGFGAPASSIGASRTCDAQMGLGSAVKNLIVRPKSQASELGIPCLGDCALGAYPKMPSSIHPGVLTGQAVKDLFDDAKASWPPLAAFPIFPSIRIKPIQY